VHEVGVARDAARLVALQLPHSASAGRRGRQLATLPYGSWSCFATRRTPSSCSSATSVAGCVLVTATSAPRREVAPPRRRRPPAAARAAPGRRQLVATAQPGSHARPAKRPWCRRGGRRTGRRASACSGQLRDLGSAARAARARRRRRQRRRACAASPSRAGTRAHLVAQRRRHLVARDTPTARAATRLVARGRASRPPGRHVAVGHALAPRGATPTTPASGSARAARACSRAARRGPAGSVVYQGVARDLALHAAHLHDLAAVHLVRPPRARAPTAGHRRRFSSTAAGSSRRAHQSARRTAAADAAGAGVTATRPAMRST
jgi:hypothetical protein